MGGSAPGCVPAAGCVPAPRGYTRGGDWWRPPGTATAAGGTHPTGMHSCLTNVIQNRKNANSPFKAVQ